MNAAISNLNTLVGDTSVSSQIESAFNDYTAPVTSVNGKTGAVTLSAGNVGATQHITMDVPSADYLRYVVGLCKVTASASSAISSYSSGRLTFKRNNGLAGSHIVYADVVMEDQYNGAKAVNYSIVTNAPTAGSGVARSSTGFKACVFTYNGVLYGGFEFYMNDANHSRVSFDGTTNCDVFCTSYYNVNTSTVTNEEIYNSIDYTTPVPSANLYFNGHRVYNTSSNPSVYAHYYTKDDPNEQEGKYLKVKIPGSRWMMAFTLRVYQMYQYYDIDISGYDYDANYWYQPSAILASSTHKSIDVKFGYDGINNLWVAIPAAGYDGVDVINVLNAYNQVDIHDGFEITCVSSLTGTVQQTITAYAPYSPNNKPNSVRDAYNGTDITFGYSADGLSSASWLAAWNGYQLRAISPTNLRTTIGAAASSHSHSSITTLGVQTPETGRVSTRGGVYTYNTMSDTVGGAANYTSVIGFGRGAGGHIEIAGQWISEGGLWYRQLRDCTDDWFAWKRIWTQGDSVTGAVWNDYAEYRESDCEEYGRVLVEVGDDTLTKSTERLQPFAGISSDTWGFCQGETEKAKTPIAVAGRVLVYPYRDRNEYKSGDVVCTAPNGTVDIMTREEITLYPDRIVGTVSCVPDYEEWGNGDREPAKVDGRIWIKVK